MSYFPIATSSVLILRRVCVCCISAQVHDELKGFIENMWSKDANYRGTISYTKEKLVKLMGEANETTETTLRNETTL